MSSQINRNASTSARSPNPLPRPPRVPATLPTSPHLHSPTRTHPSASQPRIGTCGPHTHSCPRVRDFVLQKRIRHGKSPIAALTDPLTILLPTTVHGFNVVPGAVLLPRDQTGDYAPVLAPPPRVRPSVVCARAARACCASGGTQTRGVAGECCY